ncbi:MAG: hypothetical protein FD146_2279 [Anaerolineaceae bacterium]|nr:MAG: hypothetical protein FD146_2279 [Anaerolineaceae bacterium]
MITNYQNSRKVTGMLRNVTIKRGMVWGIIIIFALLAFEAFNYSTTEFALGDVLGDLRFIGIRWSTILAFAFCGIDFAGIARLFTPEQGRDEPAEVWYLFGAWLLAAAMNAILTWWGVSVAIATHSSLSGGVVVSSTTLTKVVPVFVAIMVWLIRVLIIGTFSVAGEKLFSHADAQPRPRAITQPASSLSNVRTRQAPLTNPFRSAPKTARSESVYGRPEPTYHKVSVSARPARDTEYVDTPRHA